MEYRVGGKMNMYNFIANKNIFALNSSSRKMEIIEEGSIIKPRLKQGNNCIILKDKHLYEMTADVFKEFFSIHK